MNASFEKLAQRNGGYNLPFLIKIYNEDKSIEMRYVNDNADITYNDEVYTAGAFTYSPSNSVQGFDGGGTLQIACKDQIIDIVESSDHVILEVVGVIREGSTVTPITKFKHNYGKVTCSGMKMTFTYDADDRLKMTFPALIFTNYNNRGNA